MRFVGLPESASMVVCIAMAITGTVLMVLLISTPNSDTMAAAFPPWWSSSHIIEAAAEAGAPLRFGKFKWIVIVRGERTSLAARLRYAGALFLLDPRSLAGCSP